MMKKLLSIFLVFIGICSPVFAQTDVVGEVQETYLRRVVVEEAVGTWCGYCPRGIVGMDLMKKKYANSFIGISIHRASYGNTDNMDGAENYDELPFRSFPNSHVDRRIKDSNPGMPVIENDFRHEVAPANMKVTISDWTLNKDTRKLYITTKVRSGASHTNANYRLAYVITEDGQQGMQHNYYWDGSKGDMYGWESKPEYVQTVYDDVARGIYPSIHGQEGSIPNVLAPMKDYVYDYTVTIPAQINYINIDITKIHLVVMIVDGNTGEIVNAHRIDPTVTSAEWTDPTDASTPQLITDEEQTETPAHDAALHFVNRSGQAFSDGKRITAIHTDTHDGATVVTDDAIKVKKFSEGETSFYIRYKVLDMRPNTSVSICMNEGCSVASLQNAEGRTAEGTLSVYGAEDIGSFWGGAIQKGQSCIVQYTIINTTGGEEKEGESISVKYCYPEDHELLPWGEHAGTDEAKHIYNIDALRTYRLAILVAPNTYYTIAGYSGNRQTELANIRTHLRGQIEALNKIFIRDLGVRFQWIDIDALYVSDYSEIDWTGSMSSTYIHNHLGAILDAKLGNDGYDIGMTLSAFSDAEGMASLTGAYNTDWKAHVCAKYNGVNTGQDAKVVAHELAHMFGATHRDQRTIMSPYVNTHEVPYLAAQNIRECRKYLAKVPYFKDLLRTDLVGTTDNNQTNNYVIAKQMEVSVPVLDKTSIKAEYTLPAGGMYQFDLKATTEKGTLLYRAEMDKITEKDAYAWFYPKSPNTDGHFEWTNDETAQLATAPQAGETYDFMFVVSNPPSEDDPDFQQGEHLVQYDYAYTRLKFVNAQPLAIGKPSKTYWTYGRREQMTLTWTYDSGLYEGRKVRILLSDDYGKTFKYVLKDNVSIGTGGTGSCTFGMPAITVDRANTSAKAPGNIKVEIIGEPLFSWMQSPNDMNSKGGLTITEDKTGLVFSPEMPETAVLDCADDIKSNGGVTAYKRTSTSTKYAVTYSYEKNDDGTYTRRWVANYGTQSYMMEQVVSINGEVTPDTPATPDPETPADDPEVATAKASVQTFLDATPMTAGYPVMAQRKALQDAIDSPTATKASVEAALAAFKATREVLPTQAGHTYTYKAVYKGSEYTGDPTTTGYTNFVAPAENSVVNGSSKYVANEDLFGCLLVIGYSSQYPYYVHYHTMTGNLQKLYAADSRYYGDNITCLWRLEDVCVEKTVNSLNYATMCLPYNATVPQGVTVYKGVLKRFGSTCSISLVPVEGVLPAGEGFIIRNVGNHTFQKTSEAATADVSDNCLVGVLEDTPLSYMRNGENGEPYILSAPNNQVGFYRWNGSATKLSAGKAYLWIPTAQALTSEAILFHLEDEATGVTAIGTSTLGETPVYDLNGRKVLKPESGKVVIRGHKKEIR